MRILRRSRLLLHSRQNTILSAAAVIGFIYGFSALLGFVRNRLLAVYFGDSPLLGVYFAADDIPNLIFTFLVSGGLSSAFIPVFSKYYKRNKDEAWRMTSGVLNITLVLFLILGIVVFFSSDFIASEILARNSDLSPGNLSLLSSLMRIMMLAQLLFIFSNFFTNVMQSFNRFIIPALAPVIYNVGIILSLILLVPVFGIYAPAYGMVFGALLHMGIQFPLARQLGFRYHRILNFRDNGVREIYKLILPRTLGQTAQKFLVPLYTNLALFISAPSNIFLTFADDIQSLPVRVFGLSLGQAALPILSNTYEENDREGFKRLLVKTIHQVVFFVLPLSIMFFVLRVPLVRLAVGARKYSWESTVMTAYTLGFFSISLVTQAVVLILSRAFFAACDTKTPVKISLVTIAVNAIIAIWFIYGLGVNVWALALASAVSSALNAALLFFAINKKLGNFDIAEILRPINKMAIASLLTGFTLYTLMRLMDELVFDTTRTLGLIVLTGTVSIIGLVVYLGSSWILKVQELELIQLAVIKLKDVFRKY